MFRELQVLSNRHHGFHTVRNQVICAEALEVVEVLFQVRFSRLAAVTDRHRKVLEVVSAAARFEQVSSALVAGSAQHANTERSFCGVRSLNLTLATDLGDQSLNGVLAFVCVPVVEALVAHELAQEARISSHTRNDDAHVSVDVEHFLLGRCQVIWGFLKTDELLQAKKVQCE